MKALYFLLPAVLLVTGCDRKHNPLTLGSLTGVTSLSTEDRTYLMMGQSNLSLMAQEDISAPLTRLSPPGGNVYQCAVGGSPLSTWLKGQPNYENALKIYRDNRSHGRIAGIFFWQGESESATGTAEEANSWRERFTQMVRDIRADTGEPNLRVVFMQVGLLDSYPHALEVKAQQASVYIPNVIMTKTDGYSPDPDGHHFRLHFKELGERMATAMVYGND